MLNVVVTLASKVSKYPSKFNPPVSEKLFTFSKTDAKCVDDHLKNLKNGKATCFYGIDTQGREPHLFTVVM